MDNGASSYRRFLEGDDKGLVEIVGDYKDGLILYLNGYVNNIFIAEELTEDTFFRLITKKPMKFIIILSGKNFLNGQKMMTVFMTIILMDYFLLSRHTA